MIGKGRYKLAKNVISTTLENEAVLLDHVRGIYYGLNEVGKSVLDVLVKVPSPYEKLLQAILDEYDVEQSMAEEDLDLLLQDLLEEQLILTY